MVGILLSYWDSLFSGAMLVSGRVSIWKKNQGFCQTSPQSPTTDGSSKPKREARWIDYQPAHPAAKHFVPPQGLMGWIDGMKMCGFFEKSFKNMFNVCFFHVCLQKYIWFEGFFFGFFKLCFVYPHPRSSKYIRILS